MNKNFALVVAGIIFGIVALIHLSRLYFQFELMIAGYFIPLWFNGVGLIIALFLSIWMFRASKS